MRNAVIIKTSGNPEVVDLDSAPNELELLQGVVGGWVEAVDVKEGMTLWCNEEGKLRGLIPNFNAMRKTSAHDVLMPGDIIAGDVIITGEPDDEGRTLGLDEAQVSELMTA